MEGYLEGNELYLSGRSAEAVDAYSRALASEFDFELKLKTYLNRAQCFLRTEQFEQAVDDCTYVLARLSDLPPTERYLFLKFKCFLRRSIAFEHIGNYVKALGDVEAVLDGCPPISLRKAALSSRANLKTFVELDRSVAAGEGRPTMMVTDAQALRLSFLLEPPRSFVVGTPYNIRLCITNELGLWNRSLLQPGVEGGASDKPLLTCSLLCTDSDGERATGNKLVVRIKRTDRPSGLQDSLLQVGEDGKVTFLLALVGRCFLRLPILFNHSCCCSWMWK